MFGITQQDIQNAFNTIPVYENETITLQEGINISSTHIFFKIHYKNKRVSHIYKATLGVDVDNEQYIWTTIKSINGKNINRSPNTTKVADRIIYHVVTHLNNHFGTTFRPDYFESNRIIRQLDKEALCYPMAASQPSVQLSTILQGLRNK